MELDDNEEHDDSLVEFIRTNPSSAISARYVKLLRTEEKEECIMTMIENAAYQETWMSYFDYTENKGIVVSDEIAFEAVNDVGLDPCSAPLWLRVIHLCSDDTKKRELFHLALRLPLYQQYEIYKAYKSFEADVAKSDEQTSNSCLAFSEVIPYTDILKNEPIWPDRFVNVATCDELQRSNLCLQWNLLLPVLLDNCEKRDEFHDVNIRRAELALRQLCSQFAFEDVSWYVYATFVAVVMDDKKQASDILRRGKVTIANASIGLCICDAVLNQLDHVGDKVEKQTVNYQLFLQRLYANTANDSLQSRKRFP
uniref:Uncharacterized protein n=1 Tax=Trypanosoma vivax (strain Y486) TaxID=1055687 RepID=G0U9D3_TRYVY|nr:conserved hypothetical protein [Trypanosoma vivax Y486]